MGKTLVWLAFLLAVLSLTTGCASITRGTKDALTIETNPSGASCTLSTGEVCTSTPCTFRLPRKSEGHAECTLKGYVKSTGNWTHRTAGAGAAGMAGNVLLGGLIGLAVDAGTGATQDITPNPLVITMLKEGNEIEMEEQAIENAEPGEEEIINTGEEGDEIVVEAQAIVEAEPVEDEIRNTG